MSKSRKPFDDPRRKNLFDFIRKQAEENSSFPGDFNIQTQLKHALGEALKACPLSRCQVRKSIWEKKTPKMTEGSPTGFVENARGEYILD